MAYLLASASNDDRSSMRAKNASPFIAVGASPVSLIAPNSFHRSRVTITQSRGACSETRTAFQPVELVPL